MTLVDVTRSWSPAPTASSAVTWSNVWSTRAPTYAPSASTTPAARWGWLDTPRRRAPPRSTSASATSVTPRFVAAAVDGRRGRLPPRRADRDPLLLRRARIVRRDERPRHAQRPRGRAPARRAARRPHLDQRGLRHARDAADHARRIRSTRSRPTPPPRSRPISSPMAYHRSFDVPVVVLRPFNTYGPRQSVRAVLPTMHRASCCAAATEIRLGRLDPRRDLTFVADTVDGFVRAAHDHRHRRPDHPARAPVGPNRSATSSCSPLGCTDSAAVPVEDPSGCAPTRSEVHVLQSDPSLAIELLGWQADDLVSRTASPARSTGCRANPEAEIDRVQL